MVGVIDFFGNAVCLLNHIPVEGDDLDRLFIELNLLLVQFLRNLFDANNEINNLSLYYAIFKKKLCITFYKIYKYQNRLENIITNHGYSIGISI